MTKIYKRWPYQGHAQNAASSSIKLIKVKAENSLLKRTEKRVKSICINKITNILKPIFTDGQIRSLLSGGRRVKWNTEDIASALSLKSFSQRVYNHLRIHRGFPLPGQTTLRRWTKGFRCEPGILHEIATLLHPKVSEWSELEKLCVLSFDEMTVDGRICYDQTLDKFIGPCHNVQVAMVRGLIKNWKEPIYYDFDADMTPDILVSIIKKIQEVGLIVIGVVSDMGGKNRKTWNKLGITTEKTFLQNPDYDTRRIWVLYDAPHLLKLIRNHFLDDGVTLPDGTLVQKSCIEDLLAAETTDVRRCFHLSQTHINVTGRSRQNVSLAAQLLSHRTAMGVESILKRPEAAQFFKVFNDGFDVLNSRIPNDSRCSLRSAYGSDFKCQDDALQKLKVMCARMQFGKRKKDKPLPCQKGFITTIESVRGLYRDIKKMKGEYVLTARVNQDCLENFFSRIRGFGSFYDNPSPCEVRNRIHLLILCTDAADIPISLSSSVQQQETDGNQSSKNDSDDDLIHFITNKLFIDISDDIRMDDSHKPAEDELIFIEECESDDVIAPSEDCSDKALAYVAGYLAFRGEKWDNTLGVIGEQMVVTAELLATYEWIRLLSKGGLRYPTPAWLSTVKEFEVIFAGFHGKVLKKSDSVMRMLSADIMEKFPQIHVEIIKQYVRTRSFIRMRHLNTRMKQEQMARGAERKKRRLNDSNLKSSENSVVV